MIVQASVRTLLGYDLRRWCGGKRPGHVISSSPVLTSGSSVMDASRTAFWEEPAGRDNLDLSGYVPVCLSLSLFVC